MAELIAVSTGQARPIPGKKAKTGIYKEPVAGPVTIGRQGIADDAVLDRKHHGGVDQAVYLYFQADYDWWAPELGYAPEPGLFGENLTIAGTDSASIAVGDRFRIGALLLEVTSHRTPCMTFAAKMDDKFWVKRFHRANRPGAYCRVLAEGAVEAGMDVEIIPYPGDRISVAQFMALDGKRQIEPELMRRALTAPIHHKMRADYEQRLATLF
jgi:MOSC domain-containing protein YiiM